MAAVRIKLDHAEIAALLTSPAVEADLRQRAERIAARATDLAKGAPFGSSSTKGRKRALAMVFPASGEAAGRNAHRDILARAIEAGR